MTDNQFKRHHFWLSFLPNFHKKMAKIVDVKNTISTDLCIASFKKLLAITNNSRSFVESSQIVAVQMKH